MAIGKNYMYGNADIRFNTKQKLGGGGNGRVYSIETEKNNGEKLTAKLFWPKESSECKRRYRRFKKEIREQEELVEDGIEGIIPIFTYYLPNEEELSDSNRAWYIMPFAERFVFNTGESLVEKLMKMREIALTLSDIHQKKKAHRDLKRGNILYYNGRLCLADFGLVWTDDGDDITVEGETIGPQTILPPELRYIELDPRADYSFSDVYLFAKTLWQYVMIEDVGFSNEYNRTNSKMAIDSESIGEFVSIEFMHELMEKATKNDWKDRININECIELMDKQIEVVTAEKNRKVYKEKEADQIDESQFNILSMNDYEKIKRKMLDIRKDTRIKIYSSKQEVFEMEVLRVDLLQNMEYRIISTDGFHSLKVAVERIDYVKNEKRMILGCTPCKMDDEYTPINGFDMSEYNRVRNIALVTDGQIEYILD